MWTFCNLGICSSNVIEQVGAEQLALKKYPEVSVSFYESIDQVITEWTTRSPESIFFSHDFLKALEVSPPSDSQYRYALYYRGDTPIGLSYFQIKTIRLDESLRFEDHPDMTSAQRVTNHVKKSVAGRFRAYTMVVGNLTLTGNYGMYFPDMSASQQFELVEEAVELILPILRSQKIKIRAVMYKDFKSAEQMADMPKYTQFSVQPKMTVHFKEEWSTVDDYLAAMKSKYRVRYRRARTKAEALDKRLLSLTEIKSLESDIHRLYKHVSDQADFNLFLLKPDYFYQLQKHLGDSMRTIGYFLDGQMVGFYTAISNGKALDAHFLGYDPVYNGSMQLYLNMLYDLVEEGFRQGARKVDMSRTALEIKSSVGAVPEDLHLYLRLTNETLNKYTPKLLAYFTPEEKWKPRSPFK